jgi:hypothetical protein
MPVYNVTMPDGSTRQVQGSSLSAAYNNAGLSTPSGGGGGGAVAQSAPGTAGAAPAAPSGGGAVYQTVNGPRTVAQMEAELRAVGWGGPAGGVPIGPGSIANAYAQTAGGSVTEMPGQTYGAAAQNQPATTVPQTAATGTSLADLARAFGLGGTMTQAELDERKRQFDASLEWTKQMWAQQGLPELVIQQKAAQLQQDEFAFQSGMAQRQQALAEVTGLGGLGLQQQQAALDALKTAASLGGPSNWIQAANYARGVQQTQVPEFMRNLLTNTGAPAAMGGVGLSAPQTFGGIAAQLGGGGTSTAPTTDDLARTLAMGKQLFTQGGSALGPQALEGLSDTEQKMLGSVSQAVGADLPSFLRSYAASRIGQGAAQAS